MRSRWLSDRARSAYRRTGGDLPGSDPRPTHGAEMEGWFWRFTDPENRRVVVALCGLNRHADGDWATVAVAAHPGAIVRSAVVSSATASAERFELRAGDVLRACENRLEVSLDDVRLRVELRDRVEWPLYLGAGGIFSALPFLGQYWHPHVLGGRATGEMTVGDERRILDGADVYAEKNWGAGFPDWWWWGQAQGFRNPDLCVAFGGGHLTAGRLGVDIGGCVLRVGEDVVRFAPPTAMVRTDLGPDRWSVQARRPGWRLELEGSGGGRPATVLPVPLPAERRNVDRDLEHLAGTLRVRAWRRGQRVLDDRSYLAGLEVGSTDPERFSRLASEHTVTAS